jgi:hypothetical protein
MTSAHVLVERRVIGPGLHAEDPVVVLDIHGGRVGQATEVGAGGRGHHPGHRNRLLAAAGGSVGAGQDDGHGSLRHEGELLVDLVRVRVAGDLLQEGVWSKGKSRIGRSGAGAWSKTFPSKWAIWTCLAV